MSDATSQTYRLGDWLVEPHLNRVSRDGEELRLEAKTMDVLVYLASRAGEVISADELLSAVWPDRVVEESTVHRRISQIRRALGDDEMPRCYIETIVKRGYRVIADVSVVGDESSDVTQADDRIIPPFMAYEGDGSFVFACYSHQNRDQVYPEIARLSAQGVNVWYDEGIRTGSAWTADIARAAKNCAQFLIFVTPESVASAHCRRELAFAQSHRRSVIAVHLEPTELPDELALQIGLTQAIHRYDLAEADYERKIGQALESGRETPSEHPKSGVRSRPRRRAAALAAAAAAMVLTGGPLIAWMLASKPGSPGPATPEEIRAYMATPKRLAIRLLDQAPATAIVESEMMDAIQDMEDVMSVAYQEGGNHDYELAVGTLESGGMTTVEMRFMTPDQSIWWNEQYPNEDAPMTTFSQKRLASNELMAVLTSVFALPVQRRRFAESALYPYVKGMQEWLGPRGNKPRAMELLEEAVEIEPDLWSAWGQLIVIYVSQTGNVSFEERRARALRAAREYLRRKPPLDTTWEMGVGMIHLQFELDYAAARASFLAARRSRGLAQSPEFWLGNVAAAEGKIDEALMHYRAAGKIGPGIDEIPSKWMLARMHIVNSDYGVARRQLEETIALGKQDQVSWLGLHLDLVRALAMRGEHDPAMRHLKTMWDEFGSERPYAFPHLFALMGRRERAVDILRKMEAKLVDGTSPMAWNAVDAWFFLGEFGNAFKWLDITIDRQNFNYFPFLKKAEYLAPLRQDARFDLAMEKLKRLESGGSELPVPEIEAPSSGG